MKARGVVAATAAAAAGDGAAAAVEDDACDDDGVVALSPSSLAPRPLSVTEPLEPTLPSSSSTAALYTHRHTQALQST